VPEYKQFKLPDVGEGLTEADILKWFVKPGDTVTINQTIVEIETAKAAVELPSPYAGVVSELHVEEGATVDVGTPIITVDVDPAGSPAADGGAPGSPEAEVQAPPADEPPAPPPALRDDLVPEVARPLDDQPVEPGIIGGPAPGGRTSVLVGYGPRSVVAKRRARKGPAGSGPGGAAGTAPVAPAAPGSGAAGAAPPPLDPVADAPARGAGAEQAARRALPAQAGGGALPGEPAAGAIAAADAAAGAIAAADAGGDIAVLAKPPVRKLARDLGVDLRSVPGTGPNATVTRQDVEAAAQAATGAEPDEAGLAEAGAVFGATVPAPVWDASREQRVPIRGVRKHMAAAMVASAFTAPHVTEFVTLDMTPTMELRARLAARPELAGIKISPLLFVAKALLLAVRRHPMINSSWDEQAQEIVIREYVNLGIAAATSRGLIVPNIKDAGRLPLRDLAIALNDLTETARAGKTAPADMTRGTITITNVGIFGVDTGTPILNLGEAAILAFGTVREAPWVVDGQLAVRQVTQLALSFDHRIVDGQLGSQFLSDVASCLADPTLALLWS
jgi:pyruvate dehydrogenase E2 component (dihydrolipoamide acetyltransferase)